MTRVDVVTRTLPPNEVSEANPWDTDRFWTVPNVLSVIRLIGVPIFLWLALGPRARRLGSRSACRGRPDGLA